jgi:predicted Rossmann fold nucleotide-binding protein DprA/Smf involved in DNA uptake
MKPAAFELATKCLGNSGLFGLPLAALFCSARCPGKIILRAYDLVAQLRDSNRAVISGFHTPVEKECLAILLRGKSPIVMCPARSLERFRVPTEWKQSLAEGRLVIVSPFRPGQHRATAELAERRNEFVASLAAEIIVLHATPGGRLAKLVAALEAAGRSVTRL